MAGGGIDRLPEKAGGTVVDGSRLPSMDIQTHDGDPVREAINRAEYFDHVAVGEADGCAVMVAARVTELGFSPVMTIKVGGRWDHETATYLGGSSIQINYARVWKMDQEFGTLCREHGLIIIPPGWPENADTSDTETDHDGGAENA